MPVQIHESRKEVLAEEFEQAYFAELKQRILQEKAKGKTIYPPGPLIFNAFNKTPFDTVQVVILWQDPYHGPGQAHGMSFSVPDGIPLPPSLKNIYKEMWADPTSIESGDLTYLAKQWVFLLNAILTVNAREASSHKWFGWERFTDVVISTLSRYREWLVFLLWWNFAKQKKSLIDQSKHHILETTHPSPFSVHKWFFGCWHFAQANALLQEQGKEPIYWLPDEK